VTAQRAEPATSIRTDGSRRSGPMDARQTDIHSASPLVADHDEVIRHDSDRDDRSHAMTDAGVAGTYAMERRDNVTHKMQSVTIRGIPPETTIAHRAPRLPTMTPSMGPPTA
jgi:hypothetical protein